MRPHGQPSEKLELNKWKRGEWEELASENSSGAGPRQGKGGSLVLGKATVALSASWSTVVAGHLHFSRTKPRVLGSALADSNDLAPTHLSHRPLPVFSHHLGSPVGPARCLACGKYSEMRVWGMKYELKKKKKYGKAGRGSAWSVKLRFLHLEGLHHPRGLR